MSDEDEYTPIIEYLETLGSAFDAAAKTTRDPNIQRQRLRLSDDAWEYARVLRKLRTRAEAKEPVAP